MNRSDILGEIRKEMRDHGIDLLLGFHDGVHFIEKPNAVMALSGFKSLGHTMVILPRDGAATLVVTPSWDARRAAEHWPDMHAVGAESVMDALTIYL
jgi:hypothetical protein